MRRRVAKAKAKGRPSLPLVERCEITGCYAIAMFFDNGHRYCGTHWGITPYGQMLAIDRANRINEP